MMKTALAGLFLLVASAQSFAAISEDKRSYDLQMELTIDGKKVAAPSLIALEGAKASISQRQENSKDGSFIEVVTTEDTSKLRPNAVAMSFVVGTINQDGQRTILGTPQVITTENEKATINIINDDEEEVSLTVVVRRK